MSRLTRNTMIRQVQKASGQALALNPYIVENPAGVQFQFVILWPGVQLQFVILCGEGRECNCLRGQVNGHKATCTSPCPPPIRTPVLANELCRLFSIPRFIFACTLLRAIASFFAYWSCSLSVGQNRMLGLGFGLLCVLNAGTAGSTLVPAVVN